MSETSQFGKPVILGLPPYENPLLNPETGKPESAFSPRPGEEVPPADILAEIFPGKDGSYQTMPETIDEVRLLADSIQAFYNRSSPRSHGRLDAYSAKLHAKEDELDPPLPRLLRDFKQEVTSRFEDMEDFDGLLDTLFGQGQPAKHKQLSDETYQRWADIFYDNPKAMPMLYIFVGAAKNEGLIRKDWGHDRRHLVYPRITSRLMPKRQFSPTAHVDWFAKAIRDIEEVFEEVDSIDIANGYKTDNQGGYRPNTYASLEGIAWSIFVRHFSSPADKKFMLTYDYGGFHDFLTKMKVRMKAPAERAIFEKFQLDTCRAVSTHMLRQRVITSQGENTFHVIKPEGIESKSHIQILKTALRPGDGYNWTYERFNAEVRQNLGRSIELDKEGLYDFDTIHKALSSQSGTIPLHYPSLGR